MKTAIKKSKRIIKMTPAKITRMHLMIKKGYSQRRIADILKVSTACIWYWLKK